MFVQFCEVLLSVVYLLDIKKNPYKVTASPIHNTPLDTRYHCFRFTRLRKQQEKLTFLQITHQKSTACKSLPATTNLFNKIIDFLSNTGPDPLKNLKATKLALNVGPSSG